MSWIQKLPVLRLFSQDSLYTFAFPAFAVYMFFVHGQRKKLILLAPFLANFVFLILGPVCWTRYGLCQLYTFPVLLAVTAQSCAAGCPVPAAEKEDKSVG